MRKLNFAVLLAMLICGGGKSYAHDIAAANADGVTIYYNFTNNKTELAVTYQGFYTSSAAYSGKVVIPESVTYDGNTYSVTSIGEDAFCYCRGLTEVTIPESVTSIDLWAFEGCNGLTELTIPGSVTSIGNAAFSGCSGLEKITVENGNPIFDSREDCNAIIETSSNKLIIGCQNTIIPNSVTSIGFCAFEDCSSLTEITIPNSVTSIVDYAFYGCTGLTELTIPNSVTYIGFNTFEGCSGLTELTIPNRTSISSSAFRGCSGLTEVTIGNIVTIGERAFSDCSGLTEVTIGNVTSIGSSAFRGCSGLTEVTIGNSVAIGKRAFSDCSSLTTLYSLNTIPPSVWDNTFDYNHYTTVDVFVPAEALEAYQTADVWKEFWNLHAIDGSTAVEKVTTAEQIQTANGQITVTGLTDGTTVMVYDLSGKQVGTATSKGGQVNISTGMTAGAAAIVKVGERSVKTVMK